MNQEEQCAPGDTFTSSPTGDTKGQEANSCSEEKNGGQKITPPQMLLIAALSALALAFPSEFKVLMGRVKSISLTDIEFYPPPSEASAPRTENVPDGPCES